MWHELIALGVFVRFEVCLRRSRLGSFMLFFFVCWGVPFCLGCILLSRFTVIDLLCLSLLTLNASLFSLYIMHIVAALSMSILFSSESLVYVPIAV